MNDTARPDWVEPAADGPPGWVKALTVLAAIATGAWAAWCSVIALIGGTMPLIGYEADGDPVIFLLILFVGLPVLVVLVHWTLKLLLRPFTLAASRRDEG